MTAVDEDTRRRDAVACSLVDVRGTSDDMIYFFNVKRAHRFRDERCSRALHADVAPCVSGIDRSQTR